MGGFKRGVKALGHGLSRLAKYASPTGWIDLALGLMSDRHKGHQTKRQNQANSQWKERKYNDSRNDRYENRQWDKQDMQQNRNWHNQDRFGDRGWALEDMFQKRFWNREDRYKDREWDQDDKFRDRGWNLEDIYRDRHWQHKDEKKRHRWAKKTIKKGHKWELEADKRNRKRDKKDYLKDVIREDILKRVADERDDRKTKHLDEREDARYKVDDARNARLDELDNAIAAGRVNQYDPHEDEDRAMVLKQAAKMQKRNKYLWKQQKKEYEASKAEKAANRNATLERLMLQKSQSMEPDMSLPQHVGELVEAASPDERQRRNSNQSLYA
jgi:hypothetical protein